jgi:hypothetical protein|eukprot:SAG25_NODE_24_length_22161_cov_23.692405_25_plen_46_part_00
MPPIRRHLAADERGVSVARSCKALSASGPSFHYCCYYYYYCRACP